MTNPETIIPQALRDVLQHEGVVAIATQGADGPHLVNTWNSYIELTPDGRMLIPVGGMNVTEQNVASNASVLLTMGSREVPGQHGPGTGFLVKGNALFTTEGDEYRRVHERYSWARAVMIVRLQEATQTL